MKTRCSRWCEVLAAVLAALFLAAGVSAAAGDFSLVDQGWRILEQDGKRVVEMRVLLANNSSAPSSYEVQFRVERQTKPAPNVAEGTSTPAAGEPQPEWEVVSRVSVKGGPLAPGKAEVVKAVFPHEVLQPGKACRFFAGLVEPDTGTVLATTSITAAKIAATGIAALSGAQVVAAVGAAAAIAGGLGGGGGEEQPATISGSGTMVGEHESHRVSDEWVEYGSGDIDVTSAAGHLVLTYTYDASGPDATSLTASATASGTFTPAGAGDPEAVTISSATAQITQAGDRQEAGGVITRTGSVATGTFSGTIGARAWSGVLTMTEGVMTLNLASDTGSHHFTIQFTAS